MSRRARSPRAPRRRRTGKPPRWLLVGALAASTAFGVRTVASASTLALPARRFELPARVETVAQLGAPGQHRAAQDTPARRFDIPPGPLGAALAAFQEATGVRFEVAHDAISSLSSPGVSGLFTLDQALAELLLGTGVTFRFTAGGAVALELTALAETVEVTAPVAPSSPKYLAPLRDTPQTLTIIPRHQMEEQGATTLREVLRNVTGISIQAGEGGGGLPGDNLAIRGFAARNDIFVDGVRDFGAYSRDPFNIEQVEVTKGPGSLYTGRGSTGGSLNLSSKTPRADASLGGTLGIGGDRYQRATIDVNQPITAFGIPGAAVRLNAVWNEADTPGRDAVTSERWGVAPSLAFGLGTPTRVTVSYSHLAEEGIPDYGLPWIPNTNLPLAGHADQPAPVDFDNFYGLVDRDYEKTTAGIATAQVEHDFGDDLSLRSLLRHGRSTRDSLITAPRFASTTGTDLNRQLQSRDLTDTILAQQNDLTFHFETGSLAHALLAGTELARETSEDHARSGPAAPLADLFDPDPDAPYTGPVTRTGARTEGTATTTALYASDTVRIGERWQVTGGLRWDRFGIEYESVAVGGAATPFERTDEMLSWRAGVVHNPRPGGSVYLAYGTSFNPAADSNTGLSLAASTAGLEPEKSRGWEAGSKWDLFDNRLALSSAVFQTEKTNARTPGVNPGDPPTVLEGEQRIQGLELGLSGSLTDRWSASFGYTFLDSEVLKSNNPAEAGNELGNTPRHSASLWTTFQVRPGFEIGGGAQYVDDRFHNNTATRVAPGYLLFDAMAAYDVNEIFTLRLNLHNLADERYIDRVGGGHFVPGAGRSISLTTSFGL